MNFRTVLRNATRPEHDHLDGVFTALNIAEHQDFASFIDVHLVCFQLMADAAEVGSYSHKLLCQMVDSLALDLETLGGTQTQTAETLPAMLDPLAIDYLVAGSRLGSKILYKRWSASNDPIVHLSNNYFSLDSDALFWPTTCEALADITPDSQRANAITRDTKLLFGLFSLVYDDVRAKEAVTR